MSRHYDVVGSSDFTPEKLQAAVERAVGIAVGRSISEGINGIEIESETQATIVVEGAQPSRWLFTFRVQRIAE